MKKIDYRFKFLYAIGIIFIVAGHVNGGAFNLFDNFFHYYSFHLALFAFASGYFYKVENESYMLNYIKKKFLKLIVPLYLWNTIYGVVLFLFRHYKDFSIGSELSVYNLLISPLTHSHKFIFNLSTWFLGALFLVEVFNIIFRVLFKKTKINNYIIFIIYLLLGVLSVYLANKGFNREFYLLLDRFLYLLPFYGLGILYKSNLEKKDNLPNWLYFLIVFAAALIIITLNDGTVHYIVAWCSDYDSNLFLPFIIGVIGIAFWLRISKILEPCIKKMKVICLIGDNTYNIMIHHFLAFFILKYIFGEFSKFWPLFNGFDWDQFKSDVWYYFVPNGNKQWLICYLAIGIFLPIFFGKIISIIKNVFKKNNKSKKLLLS